MRLCGGFLINDDRTMRYLKAAVLAVSDAVLLVFSLGIACLLVNHRLPILDLSLLPMLIFAVFLQLLVFLRFGLYRAVLRYASIDFLITVLKAVTVANIVFVTSLYIVQVHILLSVIFVDWLLTVFFVGGGRFVVRYYFELRNRYRSGKRVLIYGAGDMGVLALRQLMLNKTVRYWPIGFIDDDKTKHGTVIHGVKVLGTNAELEQITERYRAEEVVVAIAGINGEQLRNVIKRCRQMNIACKIMPCFSRLFESNVRNVELADLMRRTPRDLDKVSIRDYLEDKVILVTGAAGSIGSEIVRQCLKYDPKCILAVDQSEYGLYSIQEELGNVNIKHILCDTKDVNSIERVFKGNKIDIVFHAAAYKHVSMLEENSIEAVKNNVGSTSSLCALADRYKIKNFVMISSDKAVRPASIMGATKRICELIVQNFDARCDTVFVAVRFGNVLGSSGSVVPKFIDQIHRGGPVTVTHPDATRYFMLVDEAVQLVLEAATIGKGGEIFILDMGKPVRITDMAEDLIYLMGRQPHKEIKVEFSGLKPGEKICEELFNDEIEERTKFREITIGKSKMMNWKWLDENIQQLLKHADKGNTDEVLGIMKVLVAEEGFMKESLRFQEIGGRLHAETLVEKVVAAN